MEKLFMEQIRKFRDRIQNRNFRGQILNNLDLNRNSNPIILNQDHSLNRKSKNQQNTNFSLLKIKINPNQGLVQNLELKSLN